MFGGEAKFLITWKIPSLFLRELMEVVKILSHSDMLSYADT